MSSNYSTPVSRSTIAFAAAATLLASTGYVQAEIKDFTNGNATQLWSEDGNWTPAGVPTASDDVVIPVGSSAVPYISVNGPGAVANNVTNNNFITIDDFTGSGSTSLAMNSYSGGAFYMRSGKVTVTNFSSTYVDIGEYYSSGSIFELGTGGSMTTANELMIGRFDTVENNIGTGTLVVNAGATVNTYALYCGVAGGAGTLLQQGGTITSPHDMYLGTDLLSAGNYILNDGTFAASGAYIGAYGGAGTLTQNGGTFSPANPLHIGYSSLGEGTYIANGGTLISPGYMFLGRVGSTGTLVVKNDALVRTGDLYLASDGSGTATLDMQGGTIQASGIFFGNTGAPTGGMNWTGGTIKNAPGVDLNLASFVSVFNIQMTGAGAHTIDIEAGRTGYVQGSAAISGGGKLTKTGEGALYMLGNNTYTGGTEVLLGTLVVGSGGQIGPGDVVCDSFFDVYSDITIGGISGTGTTTIGDGTAATAATVSSVRQSGLAINTGAGLVVSAKAVANDPAGASKVQSLALAGTPTAPTAKLDLKNNAMVIDYAGSSPIEDVRQLLKAGVETGQGIVSTSAAAGKRLGYGEASALGLSTLAGQTMDSSAIGIKYTYEGDTNLDGQVDVIDLGNLATAWQTAGVWTNGDSNYDGFVDVIDLGMLATNWQAGVGSPLGPGSLDRALAAYGLPNVAVPEPASAALIGVAGGLMLSRKRRS